MKKLSIHYWLRKRRQQATSQTAALLRERTPQSFVHLLHPEQWELCPHCGIGLLRSVTSYASFCLFCGENNSGRIDVVLPNWGQFLDGVAPTECIDVPVPDKGPHFVPGTWSPFLGV